MRIGVAQPRHKPGDVEFNRLQMLEAANLAQENGCELLIFPRRALTGRITGSEPQLHKLLEMQEHALMWLSEHLGTMAVCLGTMGIRKQGDGELSINDCITLLNGRPEDDLPPAQPHGVWQGFYVGGKRIDVCLYNHALLGKELSTPEAELLVVLTEEGWTTAYPTVQAKLNALATATKKTIVLASGAGIAGSRVLQGNSSILLPTGGFQTLGLSPSTTPLILDTEDSQHSDPEDSENNNLLNSPIIPSLPTNGEESKDAVPSSQDVAAQHEQGDAQLQALADALEVGIREWFYSNRLSRAVLGLSGGIDSALVATLAQRALGAENVLGVLLPSRYTSQQSVDDALQLAQNLGIETKTIQIDPVCTQAEQALSPIFGSMPPDTTEENIQARVRALLLMGISNKLGHVLLNTSNKSEAAVGYSTMYGDMCGALAVIGDLYKEQIYALARWLNMEKTVIPEQIINRPPTAELRPDQTDQDSLPPYSVLDHTLHLLVDLGLPTAQLPEHGIPQETAEQVQKLVRQSAYKREQMPPILKISNEPFGKANGEINLKGGWVL